MRRLLLSFKLGNDANELHVVSKNITGSVLDTSSQPESVYGEFVFAPFSVPTWNYFMWEVSQDDLFPTQDRSNNIVAFYDEVCDENNNCTRNWYNPLDKVSMMSLFDLKENETLFSTSFNLSEITTLPSDPDSGQKILWNNKDVLPNYIEDVRVFGYDIIGGNQMSIGETLVFPHFVRFKMSVSVGDKLLKDLFLTYHLTPLVIYTLNINGNNVYYALLPFVLPYNPDPNVVFNFFITPYLPAPDGGLIKRMTIGLITNIPESLGTLNVEVNVDIIGHNSIKPSWRSVSDWKSNFTFTFFKLKKDLPLVPFVGGRDVTPDTSLVSTDTSELKKLVVDLDTAYNLWFIALPPTDEDVLAFSKSSEDEDVLDSFISILI